MHRPFRSGTKRRALAAGLALGLSWMAAPAADAANAAALITGVQLTVEAYGSRPARPAPQVVCAGEVLRVEVTAQHPRGPGFPVAVAIDGAVGSERFLQFFGDPGPRRISVTAQTEEGDLESLTQEILVDSCKISTPPQVHGRVNPYHPGFVDFTVGGGFGLGPDFRGYHWDFGDGGTAATTESYVSHDYRGSLDGTAPYHSLIVQVSNQPIVGGVPAAGSLVRRYALTMMDSYWFSKRKGILQPPATTNVTLERRGGDLVGSYSIRNLEPEPVVFQYAEIEELGCEPGASTRRQVLPSDVIFQGGYGADLKDPELQEDPAFQAAMDLKSSISWLPEDAWVVPPVVEPKSPEGKTSAAVSQRTARASAATANPAFPPIPAPPGPESGFVVIPAQHTHDGFLTIRADSVDTKTCNVAFHLLGETLGGQRTYASLYFEVQENPALVGPVKNPDLATFLKTLLDRRLVPDLSFISHEDLYRLEKEGKIRRTPTGWEVI